MTDRPNVMITPQETTENGSWTPHVGQETMDFLKRSAPENSRDSLEANAISILSKGVFPEEEKGTKTGLVIGYVQSGKTMSFETVTALARDNNFQIVIVIAGVTTNLLNQSTERLANDLGLRDSSRSRRWVQLKNPSNDDESVQLESTPKRGAIRRPTLAECQISCRDTIARTCFSGFRQVCEFGLAA